MRYYRAHPYCTPDVMITAFAVVTLMLAALADAGGSELRRTGIVKAVDKARWSVVNRLVVSGSPELGARRGAATICCSLSCRGR